MQCILCSFALFFLFQCSCFNLVSLIAYDSMYCVSIDPYCMQWRQWSEAKCIPIECTGLYAAWPKASQLNAVDSMQRQWMQKIPCLVVKLIPIVCSGVHAARPNASRWNAVDFMQHGPKHPDWMQWIPCSVIECRGFHALWRNGSWLYAVESMQRGPMHPDGMQWILCSMAQIIPIECSGLYAAWLQQCNPLCSSVIHAEC